MASSSSHHPASSSSEEWEYEVFVCFRGKDTRDVFISHLIPALKKRQINAFIDDMLDRTDSINELISVLKRSALSVVIFSENFADSSFCLDEVATISQSMVDFGRRVLPVFYKIDPSIVSEDSGSYANTIEREFGARRLQFWKNEHRVRKSPEDRKKWMEALKVVAECGGYTSERFKDDFELVEAIVNCVENKLRDMSPIAESDNLIGIDVRVDKVEQLLAMDEKDFRIVVLWGMGGVGKTTLARVCYERYTSVKGIKHHFVGDINQSSGMVEIVRKLYSTLLSLNNISYHDLRRHRIRTRLSGVRVFLVFDDVGTISQLEELLLGNVFANLFAPGSRIILTTRDRKVVGSVKAKIYHVDCLSEIESLKLFRIHAFGERPPSNDLIRLSSRAVSYCKGCPLAIKVFGSTLSDKDIDYWKSYLSDMREKPTPGIHDVLEKSYSALGGDERGLFLDIAFFFYGTSKSLLIKYSPSYHALENLIDKSWCTCRVGELGEEIHVHDMLRELAWSIVNKESTRERRTRLKNPADIRKVLTKSLSFNGGCAVEGIYLDASKASEIYLEANVFQGLTTLRFFTISYSGNNGGTSRVRVPCGGIDSLPESLKWFEWQNFPSKSLPSRFHPENLVTLSLPHSPILERCWEVEPELVNLVKLDLSHCKKLVAIPDLSRSPKLEILIIQGCVKLSELPPHIQHLEKLVKLDLSICTSLTHFPAVLNEPPLMKLVWLDLSYCIKLEAIPNLSASSNLECLLLQGCKTLVELPSHIQDLNKLVLLNLSGCKKLRFLPAKLNSKFLKRVWLSHCPKVTCCPAINSNQLVDLDLRGTYVTISPAAIYTIKHGGRLRLCGKHVTCFPAISASLKYFRLCAKIDCYDDEHQRGSSPRFGRLDLVGNPQLKSLSRNIWKIVCGTLVLENCPSIESFPEISQPVTGLTQPFIEGCRKLKSLPTSINNLKSLQYIRFVHNDIKFLPSAIGELDQLGTLILSSNKSLEFVPSNIHMLVNLSKLSLAGCSRIKYLPELPPNLLTLDVSGCTLLQALPSNIGRLRWEQLCFENCPQLDTGLPREVVDNFCDHAVSNPHLKGAVQHSGSEIPEWFAYKSMNYASDSYSCMMVQLPPRNSTTKRQIQGIAFGVVCSAAAASWNSLSFGLGGTSQSDKVYMWYEKNLLGMTNKEGIRDEAEVWCERYAGLNLFFRFSIQPFFGTTPEKLKTIKIKSIGVSLLY